jgi:hypothetical protein
VGDANDYVSMAPYYWPDAARSAGLPYVRRDGQPNPKAFGDRYDKGRLQEMASNCASLALAYAFTGKEA